MAVRACAEWLLGLALLFVLIPIRMLIAQIEVAMHCSSEMTWRLNSVTEMRALPGDLARDLRRLPRDLADLWRNR